MIYTDIKLERGNLSVSSACRLFEVSLHAYTHWIKKPAKKLDVWDDRIKTVAIKNKSYGYRRIYHTLDKKVGKKRVLKSMQKQGLIRKKKHFKVCTTNSNHGLRTYSNLIKNLRVVKLNQVWVSDITYIHFRNGETAYLAGILDRFSRRCIGWQLSHNIDVQLCLDALHKAFEERDGADLSGLIHHSDQGSQYAALDYVAELEKRGILISMSRKGNPYDNAHMESFFKTVKYEEVYMDEYENFEDAYRNLKHFLEEVYNKKRLHSATGYKPPTEFEQQYKLKEVVA